MAFILLKQATVNPVGSILKVENDRGGAANKGKWEVRGGRTYTTRLKVQTDSPYVGAIQIIQSVAPVWGAYYRWPLTELHGSGTVPAWVEQDTGSFLQSIAADPDSDADDGKQWILTLEYGPFDVAHEQGDQDGNGVKNPLSKPPEVSWESAKYERSKPQDESGKPYINTVGDPLEDPPKTEESRPLLKIVRNEIFFNGTWVSQFVDHVNSDQFLGFPPNTVKCKDITGKREYEADWGFYWEVTYEFEFRDDPDGKGWTEEVLNAGYRQLVSGDPKPVMVGGAPVSSPVALTAAGAYSATASPYYLQFKPFPTASFAALNIAEDLFTAGI